MKHAMRVLNHAVALLLAALLYQQTCLAQVNPWERIKLIEPGKNVHVKLHSGKTVKGKMESWSADGLSVRQGKKKVVPVAKSDVAQVAMVAGMSRGRRAAYAGLIGGGVGAAVFGGTCASSNCEVPPGAVAAGSALLIGGIAAAIAALFPQQKDVIYTAESVPPARSASSH